MMGISNDRLGTISCGRLGSNLDLRTADTPTDFRRLLLLNGEADERIGIAVVNDELSRDQSSIAGVAPSVADVVPAELGVLVWPAISHGRACNGHEPIMDTTDVSTSSQAKLYPEPMEPRSIILTRGREVKWVIGWGKDERTNREST